MKKLPSVSIFLLFVLQLALPALKATSVALGSTSWLKATCFLWGPWLLIAVISALGLVLRWALGSEPRPAD